MENKFFGYASEAAFLKDVEREIDNRSIHDRDGARSKPAPEKLRGKPMSPERLRQAARLAGVNQQHFLNTVSRGQTGQKLVRAVKKLNEGYDREALDAAADLTVELRDENVPRAAMNALPPEIAQAYYERMVEIAEGRDQTSEEERIAARQKLLSAEYERAQRLGPGVVEQVDALAHEHPEALYNDLADDEVQVLLRAQAEQARSERSALTHFGIHDALATEMVRVGGPGSRWNDADRAQWEAELRETALNEYDKRLVSPDEAIQKAAATLEPGHTFRDALNQEIDNMAIHNRENLEAEREADWQPEEVES